MKKLRTKHIVIGVVLTYILIILGLAVSAMVSMAPTKVQVPVENTPPISNLLKISNELERKATEGDVSSQYLLGKMYYSGIGIERDIKEAFVWLSVAEFNGHMLAPRAASLARQKMTVAQIRSVGERIDNLINPTLSQMWF